MRNKNNNKKNKLCPLLDQNCLKEGCALYNELLTNCEISVLSYNLYRYSNGMKPNDDK
ncbi:hypothetical protein ACFL0B_00140 [Thermodesulfobacteriota bacterium]